MIKESVSKKHSLMRTLMFVFGVLAMFPFTIHATDYGNCYVSISANSTVYDAGYYEWHSFPSSCPSGSVASSGTLTGDATRGRVFCSTGNISASYAAYTKTYSNGCICHQVSCAGGQSVSISGGGGSVHYSSSSQARSSSSVRSSSSARSSSSVRSSSSTKISDIIVKNGSDNNKVTSNKSSAKTGDVVTLTVSHEKGYLLYDLTIKDESDHEINPNGCLWYYSGNTCTFEMPSSKVTITPKFTSKLNADGGLFINMPKSGTLTVDVPDDVSSFNVYDDGGVNGDYSSYCAGYLKLKTNTDSDKFSLNGSVYTEKGYDYFYVYDGLSTGDKMLIEKMDGTNNPINAVTSSHNKMMLKFSSDGSVFKSGLALTVIVVRNLNNENISVADVPAQTYTGSAICPAITVKDGEKTLLQGTDYTVACSNNINPGTATMTITGMGLYIGSTTRQFEISPKSVAHFELAYENHLIYTGSAICPEVVVKDGEKTLLQGTDYTVECENNVNVGEKATIGVFGKGNYTGSQYGPFAIQPKSIASEGVLMTATWNKENSKYVPTVSVKDGENTLSEGNDYTIETSSLNGYLTATVLGNGNYTGSTDKKSNILTGTANDAVMVPANADVILWNATFEGGIICEGDATITIEGQNSVSANGITAEGNITIGWSNMNDRITISSIATNSNVLVANAQVFKDEYNTIYSGTLTSEQIAAIAGKTLSPAVLYTLAFVTGDKDVVVESQLVVSGATPVKPKDPVRTNFSFRGWYADQNCATPFNWTIPLTEDATIYAKWEKSNDPVKYLDENGEEQTITDYVLLTGNESADDEMFEKSGWIVVQGEVTYDEQDGHGFAFRLVQDDKWNVIGPDVNLILADGAKLTVKNTKTTSKLRNLTIYAQSTGKDMGQLKITSERDAFIINKSFVVNGGSVDITSNSYAVFADDGVVVNGGAINLKANYNAIVSYGSTIVKNGVVSANSNSDVIYTDKFIVKGGSVTVAGATGIQAKEFRIYGGAVDATATGKSYEGSAIYVYDEFDVNGGSVSVHAKAENDKGIFIYGATAHLNAGTITAEGEGKGFVAEPTCSSSTVEFAGVTITADSYLASSSVIKVADGIYYTDGEGNVFDGFIYKKDEDKRVNIDKLEAIAGKTLSPFNPLFITFVTGADDIVVAPQPFVSGFAAAKPSVYPKRRGYKFAGWFADKDFKNEFDWSAKRTQGTTAYINWEPLTAVTYLDEYGEEQTVTDYELLTGYESIDDEMFEKGGWFVVQGEVTYDEQDGHVFAFRLVQDDKWSVIGPDVNLILADGAKLTVKNTQGSSMFRDISIYAQSTGKNMGQFEISAEDYAVYVDENFTVNGGSVTASGYCAINSYGIIRINGGVVDATSTGTYGYAIKASDVYINGGLVTVRTKGSSSYGVYLDDATAHLNAGTIVVEGAGNGFVATSENSSSTVEFAGATVTANSYQSLNGGIFKVADGLKYTDGEGSTYQGELSLEHLSAITGKTLSPIAGPIVIVADAGGKNRAYINGTYVGQEPVDISSDVKVDALSMARGFTIGKYSTTMLPFDVNTANIGGLDVVLRYNGIKTVDNKSSIRMKVVWATKDWVEKNDIRNDKGALMQYAHADLTANTPYLVQMNDATFRLKRGAFPLTLKETTPADVSIDGWTFRGTWEYKKWGPSCSTEKQNCDPETGYAYGFAASTSEANKISVGDFVKVGEGAWISPLRAYLVKQNLQKARANGAYVMRSSFAQEELPELMSIVIDNEDGNEEHTTVIGHFNTRTGEFKMNNAATKRTFDVKGRNVGGKANKARGAYYGKKVRKK